MSTIMGWSAGHLDIAHFLLHLLFALLHFLDVCDNRSDLLAPLTGDFFSLGILLEDRVAELENDETYVKHTHIGHKRSLQATRERSYMFEIPL